MLFMVGELEQLDENRKPIRLGTSETASFAGEKQRITARAERREMRPEAELRDENDFHTPKRNKISV